MLGRSHVLVGALGWLAVAPATAVALGHPLDPGQVAAGALLCSGAALLPDVDHHNGTIAHTLGPVTQTICGVVEKVSGGHRHATHSVVMAGVFGVLAWMLMWWSWGVFAMFLVCGTWALRMFGPRSLDRSLFGCGEVAAAGVLAWWVASTLDGSGWMPAAVVAGSLLHLVADLVTKGPLPLLWPISKRRFSVGVITTGHAGEHVLAPFLVVGIVWLMWVHVVSVARFGGFVAPDLVGSAHGLWNGLLDLLPR